MYVTGIRAGLHLEIGATQIACGRSPFSGPLLLQTFAAGQDLKAKGKAKSKGGKKRKADEDVGDESLDLGLVAYLYRTVCTCCLMHCSVC